MAGVGEPAHAVRSVEPVVLESLLLLVLHDNDDNNDNTQVMVVLIARANPCHKKSNRRGVTVKHKVVCHPDQSAVASFSTASR